MNATESLIYITVVKHRLMRVEERAGGWSDGCACFWSGSDHDMHVAMMVAQALLPDPQPVPRGVERGVGWVQERLLEPPPTENTHKEWLHN